MLPRMYFQCVFRCVRLPRPRRRACCSGVRQPDHPDRLLHRVSAGLPRHTHNGNGKTMLQENADEIPVTS